MTKAKVILTVLSAALCFTARADSDGLKTTIKDKATKLGFHNEVTVEPPDGQLRGVIYFDAERSPYGSDLINFSTTALLVARPSGGDIPRRFTMSYMATDGGCMQRAFQRIPNINRDPHVTLVVDLCSSGLSCVPEHYKKLYLEMRIQYFVTSTDRDEFHEPTGLHDRLKDWRLTFGPYNFGDC